MEHIKQIAAGLNGLPMDAMLVTSLLNKQYALDFPAFSGVLLVSRTKSWFLAEASVLAGLELKDAEPVPVTDGRYAETVERLMTKLGGKTLGFEEETISWKEFMPYQGISCRMVPGQALMKTVRAAKRPDEIERLRAAQVVTDQAFAHVLKKLRPGLTEHEVAGMLAEGMLAGGAFQLSFPPIVASGPNGSNPHGFASERVLQKGDFVTMDFGCIVDGYCSDMTRTVALGPVSAEMRRVYDTVLAAQQAGMAAARAGVTGQEIDAAGRKVIEDAGYGPYFIHNFGHGLGIDGHETPGAGRLDTTPLPEGAVVSAEPGIYLPGQFGVRIEDIIVLGKDGCESLMTSPKELLILD